MDKILHTAMQNTISQSESTGNALPDEQYVMDTFARIPVEFVSGDGMELFDRSGKRYYDFLSGIGTVNLGHSNPDVVDAVCAQTKKLSHVSNFFYIEHRAELAEKLVALFSGEFLSSLNMSPQNYGDDKLENATDEARQDTSDTIGFEKSYQDTTDEEYPASRKEAENDAYDIHEFCDDASGRKINASVFFANSGAEAVEGALKLARKWGYESKPEAHTIVTATGSFHGRTYGAMSATGQPERAVPFAPGVPGFAYVPFNDVEALDATLGSDTIALMLEVVQGESGVWPATQEYVTKAAEWCRDRNILLIIDEIQTGIYRTGLPFAFQHYRIVPDIITSAKALGNGFPIGVVIARDEIASTFAPGDHGTTFGGGPVACAAALATLDAFDRLGIDGQSIGEHVIQIGKYASSKLAEIPFITEVRGIGLMIGMTLASDLSLDAVALRDALCERGFIVNAIGDSYLRLLPPLICKKMHIDALIGAFYDIIETQGKEAS